MIVLSALFINLELICGTLVTPEEAAVSTELQSSEAGTGKPILYWYITYTEIFGIFRWL